MSWTRVEFNQQRFVAACADDTDGIVIPHRFDIPPLPSSRDHLAGRSGSELKNAALGARVPFLIDIETWRLPYLEGREDMSFGKDVHTPIADAVPLPLTPGQLDDVASLQALVRSSIAAQVGAATMFAPYFRFDDMDDPWLEVNLRCIRLSRALIGGQSLGAWVYVTLDTVRSGAIPYVAERYAVELPAGASVVLTVSDMQPGLSPEDLAEYLRAVAAFESVGLSVTTDRAGIYSVPASAYSAGCVLGTRLYQTAPASPRFSSDHNPKIKLRYFERRLARMLAREDAKRRREAGRIAKCSHPGCRAALSARRSDNLLVRLHNAHDIRIELMRVRRLGAEHAVWAWSNSRYKALRVWAQALALASERSEQA